MFAKGKAMDYRMIGAAGLLALAACGGGGGANMSAEEVAEELSETKLQPGRWEMTQEVISVEAPGMPKEALAQMSPPKATNITCITPEQASAPKAEILAAQQNGSCTYSNWSMSGGRMKGTMSCSGAGMPGKMVTSIDGEYRETSYDLTVESKMDGVPGGMTLKARTTARRLGECTGQEGRG